MNGAVSRYGRQRATHALDKTGSAEKDAQRTMCGKLRRSGVLIGRWSLDVNCQACLKSIARHRAGKDYGTPD